MTKQIRVYALGGAGINICDSFNPSGDSFPTLKIVGIDTSSANFRGTSYKENKFIFTNEDGEFLDGSGAGQDTNMEIIKDNIKNVVGLFEPTEINFLVFSCSGGSGSAIAMAMMEYLNNNNINAIPICIYDDTSRRYAQNSLNVLNNFSNIARETEKPIVMSLVKNNERKTTDNIIKTKIAELSALYSGVVDELDSKDLDLWLNFNLKHAKEYEPDLYMLETFDTQLDSKSLGKNVDIVVVATLSTRDNQNIQVYKDGTMVNHQTVGYLSKDIKLNVPCIHYCILDGACVQVYKDLDSKIKASKAALEAKPSIKTKISAKNMSLD